MTVASRILGALTVAVLTCSSGASAAEPTSPAPALPPGAEAWGAARFGMTVEEVLAAIGPEASASRPR